MKNFLIPIVCFVLWAIFATSFLWNQIENRYLIGHNAWYLDWTIAVFNFLDQNILLPEKYNERWEFFWYKDFSISIIESNWVTTVKLQK